VPGGEIRPDTETLEGKIVDLVIASPYVQVVLWDTKGYVGRSVRLGCGHHHLTGALAGKVASLQLYINTRPYGACAANTQTTSAWDQPNRLRNGDFSPRVPRS
jgi:hypothetical protein